MTKRSVESDKPIEHRVPTPGTVRQLYGTAFACAKPGCRAGLYTLNADTGQHVLNSHVAHIHARSEGGPRWDPAMSEADNRDVGNLLLLCFPHAWEIDQVPDEYPAEMLRSWKRDQLADSERAHRSWQISDEEARVAVTPFDLDADIEKISAVLPFNPRMRSRIETWQLAIRRGHAMRVSRLTPLVPAERRPAVLAWMAARQEPLVEVPVGQVRVLVGRLGAGKSEHALRWWGQAVQVAANDPDIEIPLFLPARHITVSLELAIANELGGDPSGRCQVVIDDLDSVPLREAARLLAEARQLVHTWPQVSVLATARPGIPVPDEEKVLVEPWPAQLGAELATLALGDDIPWHLWNTETADLLTSPLTALGLAARVQIGRDVKVSRAQLLADLATMVIDSQSHEVADGTWQDLARLAVRILGQSQPVTGASFGSLPLVRRLTATGLVVGDHTELTFALPVFEQYFGSEALRMGLADLETTAAASSFPRWRYALAFAVSTATGQDQERLFAGLATVNPAAAFWILDEIADASAGRTHDGPSDEAIAAFISRRDPTGEVTAEPDLAIRAGLWLRGAEQALLTGLGPLAESLTRHRDGRLVQWGTWLQNGHLTLARSRDQLPPPYVVKLPEMFPSLGQWHRVESVRFPTSDLGRWLRAQTALQEQLQDMIRRRTLPVPRTSWLAHERLYLLADFVYNYSAARHRRTIHLAELRDTVTKWMERVNRSVRSTWQGTGRSVDSDDIRWLAAQLDMEDGNTLLPPWPEGDQPGAGRWIWQTYSPELTLTLATDIVRQALIGYRQLVETSFPAFGDALGLYSMLPIRVEGLIRRPINDENAHTIDMIVSLDTDHDAQRSDVPSVDLRLVPDDGDVFWTFIQERRSAARTTFGQSPLQHVDLPLGHTFPATSLAYRWLVQDLAAVGWLNDHHRLLD
ncbi:hypothetical protein OG400_18835 [Micromonospora ureilytica]|uniref:hypothetical protein n=1 Tax=Micromonospora ureilytica TaxID=709868 RepID=UPI002E0F2B3C|nr:hypothetical protein OG400_18835 [Micromonospora ureilytica]